MSEEYLPGSLLSIRMENFMKHDNLLIDLKPHVNFITGRNGSGKSAILVALSVGLGSTTKISGRGNNMAELIKDGKNSASIIITIKNGPEGYRYDFYGETIVITRKIHRGSTSFDIGGFPKNPYGAVREELSRILTFFNIQIDNPCSIMHQDIAKEFIGNSSPQRKYELFMKGTLLSKLDEDIKTIKERTDTVKAMRKSRQEEKQILDSDFEEKKRLYEIAQEADGIHAHIIQIENELAWSLYHKTKVEADTIGSRFQEVQAKVERQKASVRDKEQILKQAQAEAEEMSHKMSAIHQELAKIGVEKRQIEDKIQGIKTQLSSLKSRLNQRENVAKKADSDIERNQRDLNKILEKKNKATEDSERKLAQFKAEHEETLNSLNSELKELKDNHSNVSYDLEVKSEEEEKFKIQLQQIKSAKNQTENKLRDLNKRVGVNKDDSLAAKIARSSRNFDAPPIGPISNFIKMGSQYHEWSLAASNVLSKTLDLWLVISHKDGEELRKILQQNGVKNPAIMKTDFIKQPYRFSSPFEQIAPRNPGTVPLLDTLTFINEDRRIKNGSFRVADVVRNVVIDNSQAEMYLCVHEPERAREIIDKNDKNNAISTITPDGTVYRIQNGFFARSGAKVKDSKIGVDETQRLSQLKTQLEEEESQLYECDRQYQKIADQLNFLKRKKSELQKKISNLNSQISTLQVELEHPPEFGEDFGLRLNQIQSRIDTIKKDKENAEKEIPNLQSQISTLKLEKDDKVKERKAIDEKLIDTNQFADETSKLNEKLTQAQNIFNVEKKKLNSDSDLLEKYKKKYDDANTKKEEELAKVRRHSPECEELYINNPNIRSPEELSPLLLNEKSKYEEAQKIHGLDFNQVRQDYKKIKKDVDTANKFLSELDIFLEKAKEAIDLREDKLKTIQSSITRRAKVSFLQYQKQRKFAGRLNINHQDSKIDIEVKPSSEGEYTSSTNLSGGEKSYSLVSLLLALWEVMECPFYCVDEFDVFMDDVNRQAATSLLVKGAGEIMTNRQFIFITPLSLDQLKNDNKVTVFEVQSGR